jgi:hypothetical protein
LRGKIINKKFSGYKRQNRPHSSELVRIEHGSNLIQTKITYDIRACIR